MAITNSKIIDSQFPFFYSPSNLQKGLCSRPVLNRAAPKNNSRTIFAASRPRRRPNGWNWRSRWPSKKSASPVQFNKGRRPWLWFPRHAQGEASSSSSAPVPFACDYSYQRASQPGPVYTCGLSVLHKPATPVLSTQSRPSCLIVH